MILICLLQLLAVITTNAQKTGIPKLTGPYLGQKPPGMVPEVFAPQIITEALHSIAVFSPDGCEVFYVPWSTLRMATMKQKNGVWTKPNIVPFATTHDAENPWITADGTRMYFTSTRPLEAEGLKERKKFWNENIWYVDREKDGWSEAVPLGQEVNSMDLHWQFSIDDRNGDLYFSASSGEGGGRSDIYKSAFFNGRHTNPVKLSEAINTEGDEDTPFIASDGSYLIFARKPGTDTFADLYISFRNQDGSWRKAVGLGSRINSDAHEVCPFMTRNAKYFFFISMRSGKPQVYWVDAKVIEEHHPTTPGDAIFAAGEQTGLQGPYLGQKPPGRTPEIFAPGIVSTDMYNHCTIAVSRDGTEIYWAMAPLDAPRRIYCSRVLHGAWSRPEIVGFTRSDDGDCPVLSPDGRKLFFNSNRPLPHGTIRRERIWCVVRTPAGWEAPVPLGPEINDEHLHWQVSVDAKGNLYFGSERAGSKGRDDVFMAEFMNGVYRKPVSLGPEINSEAHEGNPFIAPDGSFLMFSRGGLWISFRQNDGSWTRAHNMGEVFEGALCPYVSPDQKYIFFLKMGQGSNDIWWVDAGFIEELRSKQQRLESSTPKTRS